MFSACSFLGIALTLAIASSALSPQAGAEGIPGTLPETIGTTRVRGVPSFDSGSIRHDGPKQWRWLSVPFSRLVLNPSKITDASQPLSPELDLNAGYYAGPQPHRFLRLATMGLLTPEAARGEGTPWRHEVRPGEAWRGDKADWSFEGVTIGARDTAGILTVTGEHQTWGHAAWRIHPPLDASSGAIRIRIASVDDAWALKLSSPATDADVPIQFDSHQTGVFIYDLGSIEGWRGQDYFDLKLFGSGTGSALAVESIEVELWRNDAGVGSADAVTTAWYPHQLTFDARYDAADAVIRGADFFYDENTVVRTLDLDAPAETSLVLRFQGLPYGQTWTHDAETGALLFEGREFAYALCIVSQLPDGHGYAPAPLAYGEIGWQWRGDAPLAAGKNRFAMSAAFATKAEGAGKALERALAAAHAGDFDERLATRKAEWDKRLAAVPAPARFGIKAVDAKGVTPGDHRRAYYAAWTFVLQNVLPPMPENEFPYPQTPTGKPSLWAEGSSQARASAAWESFFGQQFLAWADPHTAWDAFTGIMSHVDEDGWLDGECLPSRKAQTAWILYALSGDRERLRQVYPPISRYLRWREHNPRWIFKDHDDPNEKDTNFADSLLLDLEYAERIAEELNEDPEEWQAMAQRVTANYAQWFFPEDEPFPFQIYDAGTGERHTGHPTWVCSGLYLSGLPAEADGKLVRLFRHLYNPGRELAGLDFCKYPIASMTAYGLLERGMFEEARGFVNATLRDVIRVGQFAENYSYDPLRSWGVQDSLFGVGIVIDFTLMHNGMRIDRGLPEPWEPHIGSRKNEDAR